MFELCCIEYALFSVCGKPWAAYDLDHGGSLRLDAISLRNTNLSQPVIPPVLDPGSRVLAVELPTVNTDGTPVPVCISLDLVKRSCVSHIYF